MLNHPFVNSSIPDKIVKVQLREVIDKARRRRDDQKAAAAQAIAPPTKQQSGQNGSNATASPSPANQNAPPHQMAHQGGPTGLPVTNQAAVASDHSDSEDEGGPQEPEIEQPR